jgi:short-subunit dehydrogenase
MPEINQEDHDEISGVGSSAGDARVRNGGVMNVSLRSSCILISGASRGLGAALAEELAREGITLILLGRDLAALNETARLCEARGATCHVHVCDLADREALRDLAADLMEAGLSPDLVISNAGVLEGRADGHVVEGGELARGLLEINLLGAIDLVWLFLPAMLKRRKGQVLFVSSLAAFTPLADAAAYSASKAALVSYGLALRAALKGSGVTIQVVCPGYIASPMGQRHMGRRPSEISAGDAARIICKQLRSNRGLFGFPSHLFHFSRMSLLVPERLRLWAVSSLRFHVK